jgi:hypothetical protein
MACMSLRRRRNREAVVTDAVDSLWDTLSRCVMATGRGRRHPGAIPELPSISAETDISFAWNLQISALWVGRRGRKPAGHDTPGFDPDESSLR